MGSRIRRIIVFRCTNNGDNFGNPGFTDYVIFNANENNNIQNAFVHRVTIPGERDVAENPVPGVPLSEYQDTGTGNVTYIIEGTVSQKDGGSVNGINAIIAKMQQWDEQDSEVPGTFPYGRFGIVYEGMAVYSLTPIATKGLYLKKIEWVDDMEMDNPVAFTMTLFKSIQPGTS